MFILLLLILLLIANIYCAFYYNIYYSTYILKVISRNSLLRNKYQIISLNINN